MIDYHSLARAGCLHPDGAPVTAPCVAQRQLRSAAKEVMEMKGCFQRVGVRPSPEFALWRSAESQLAHWKAMAGSTE